MKKMRKIISVLCVLMMCLTSFSYPIQAKVLNESFVVGDFREFSQSDINRYLSKSSASPSENTVKKINDDFKILNELVIPLNLIEIKEITINAEEKITYLVSYGEYQNLITVDSASSGKTDILVNQGDISNIMTFCDDGRFYVDGKEVKNQKDTMINSPVMRRAQEIWENGYPLVGVPSDYIYYAFIDQYADLRLPNYLYAISMIVFASIIGAVCGPAGFIMGCLDATYQYFCRTDPFTSAISYKSIVYYMNSGNAYVPSVNGYASQYRFTFYTKANYTGSTYSETWYRLLLI